MKSEESCKGFVFVSRYTPGLKNGEDVEFKQGEKVTYRMRNGTIYRIVIDSKLMKSSDSRYYGYEAIFPDGERCFAPEIGIIGWEGKC